MVEPPVLSSHPLGPQFHSEFYPYYLASQPSQSSESHLYSDLCYSDSGKGQMQCEIALRLVMLASLSFMTAGVAAPLFLGEIGLYFAIRHRAEERVKNNFQESELTVGFCKSFGEFEKSQGLMQPGDILFCKMQDRAAYSIKLSNGKHHCFLADWREDDHLSSDPDLITQRFLQDLKDSFKGSLYESSTTGSAVAVSLGMCLTILFMPLMLNPFVLAATLTAVITAGITFGGFLAAYLTPLPTLSEKVFVEATQSGWFNLFSNRSDDYEPVAASGTEETALVECGL